uniref:Putative exodeoxyribonuclease 8 PDDEXK-like domain-containing protein n=1 Tax=viral metagenome TaxID=1070528 RepID=A0A6M3KS37_9ZZZZ
MNGLYENITHADYHAMTDRISNSYLSRLDKCPAAAKVPLPETPAMTFGRAFHSFILDGMVAFSRDVLILPEINRRTNAGKEEYLALVTNNPDKAIITHDELKSIMAMDKSVKAHPLARNLIGTGTNEVSVFWDDPFSGLPCKARPDKVPGQNTLVDLKKTRGASAHSFQRSIIDFGYHRQAAFYLDGMTKATGEKYDLFAFITVEDSEPYRTEVYTLSQDFIDYGRLEYQRLINIENQCRQKGEWPNYTSAEATEIELPKYINFGGRL